MTLVNPFHFETPADRWSFVNREDLIPKVERIISDPKGRALMIGRRRMGKTSLMKHAARHAGTPFLFVDLSTATNLNEAAKKLLGALPPSPPSVAEKMLKLLRKYEVLVKLVGGKVLELSAQIRPTGGGEDLQTLEQVLNLINDRAMIEDIVYCVALDEFQDIRKLAGSDRAEWSLRGVIQHHSQVSYLLTGSDHRLQKWMTEPEAAFYKQLTTIELGPIDASVLADWIDARAARGGPAGANFGKEVVAAAGPCTGDIVRLAKVVFQQAAEKRDVDVRAAFDEVALEDLHAEFVGLWRPLLHTGRSVLRAIAAGRPPRSAKTLEEFGIGGGGTAGSAIDLLFDRQLLTRDVDGTVIFDSPFFRRWVEFNSV